MNSLSFFRAQFLFCLLSCLALLCGCLNVIVFCFSFLFREWQYTGLIGLPVVSSITCFFAIFDVFLMYVYIFMEIKIDKCEIFHFFWSQT